MEEASFNGLKNDAKLNKDLQENLLKEQKGVCAYCQQLIQRPQEGGKMKIEHHCEQSICNGNNTKPDRQLDYKNLFGVCGGQIGYPKILHCDSSKAKFKPETGLPMEINPLQDGHMAMIKYSSTGKITNSKFQNEVDYILNLNNSTLKELRKRQWNLICSFSKSKGKMNTSKMKKLVDSRLALTNNRFRYPFPGMYEYMIQKFKL